MLVPVFINIKDHVDVGQNITLVIFCYNQAHFILESVSSIIGQLKTCDQLIIIDDCSSDSTAYIAKKYIESNLPDYSVSIYTKIKNTGVNHSVNSAFELALNDNIISLAGDDYYHEGAIDLIRTTIHSRPKYSLVFASCTVVDTAGSVIGYTDYLSNFKPIDIYMLSERGNGNLDGHSQICWNKSLFSVFGPLSGEVSNEDDQFILRATLLGGIIVVPVRIRAYRKSNMGMSHPMVNFDASSQEYLKGIIEPLKNRLSNYKVIFKNLEAIKQSKYSFGCDLVIVMKNFSRCMETLSLAIILLSTKSVFKRLKIFFEFVHSHGLSRSMYFRQSLIILISPNLYYQIKKFLYKIKFSD